MLTAALRDKLALYLRAKDAYYNKTAIMPDSEFDDLEAELLQACPDHPALSAVGHATNSMEKVVHESPMLSMEKALTTEALLAWCDSRFADMGNFHYVYSAKLDGLACELRYKQSALIQAVSRGDGEVGADITAKLRYIAPAFLQGLVPWSGRIRGEVVMPFAGFEAINKTEPTPIANPRNGATGLINESAIRPDKLRHLKFKAYEMLPDEDREAETYWRELCALRSLGLEVPRSTVRQSLPQGPGWQWEHVLAVTKWFIEQRATAEEAWDGVVARVNDNVEGARLGRTAKFWKRAVAWKFAPEEATIQVTGIEWSQGTTDITPIVLFHPVSLDGAVIGRASGKSVKNMMDIGAFPGAKLKLVRSGGVIPWLQAGPNSSESHPVDMLAAIHATMPTECPGCKGPVTLTLDRAHFRCSNAACDGALARRLEILAKALDMEYFGPANCTGLVQCGAVNSLSDLLLLTQEFNKLPNCPVGMGMAAKMEDEVSKAKAKEHPPWKVLGSIGIPRLGVDSARRLILGAGSLQQALEADIVALKKHLGYTSNEVAGALHQAIQTARTELDALTTNGLRIASSAQARSGLKLSGIAVVVTGDLDGFSRDEFKQLVEAHGGKLGTSVSSKTTCLVTNDPSTQTGKARDAAKFQKPIFNQQQFFDRYQIDPNTKES